MTKLFPPYRFHLLVATLLVFLVGCQKDHFLPAPSASDHRLQTTHFPISIGEAQKHFEQLGEVKPVALNSLDEEKVYLGEVAPDWGNAFLGTAVTGQEMAIAPLVGNNLSTLNQGRAGIKLLFSKSGADSINVQLLVYVLDSSYQVSTHGVPSWSTFTGLFLFFDLAQNFKHGVRVINGVPMGKVVNIRVESGYQQAEDRGDGDCATHFTSVLTDCIMAFSDCSDVSIVGYEECGSGFAGGVSSGGGGSTTGGGNGGGGNGGGTTFIPDVTLPSFLLGFYNIPLNLWSTQHVVMPPGYDLDLVEKLQKIDQVVVFTTERFDYFQGHPESVIPFYNFIYASGLSNGEGNYFEALLDLAVKLKLAGPQVAWFTSNIGEIAKATQFAAGHNYDTHASLAVRLMVDLHAANAFPINVSSAAYQQIISQYAGELGVDNATGLAESFAMAYAMEFAILKYHDIQDHPNPNDRSSDMWLGAQAAWKVSVEAIHIGLDVIGLVPVIGEAADITNATIYAFQGNWQDATLSVLGTVPFAGWFSTIPRLGKRVITNAAGLTTLIFKNDNGIVRFYNNKNACRAQLRKILGTPADWVAHHIMPLEHDIKEIVQHAAKATDRTPFHVNQPGNGISIHEVMHASGQGHDNYNAQMGQRLDRLWELYGNQSSEVARNKLNEYLAEVRQLIVASPNVKTNELVLPPVQ